MERQNPKLGTPGEVKSGSQLVRLIIAVHSPQRASLNRLLIGPAEKSSEKFPGVATIAFLCSPVCGQDSQNWGNFCDFRRDLVGCSPQPRLYGGESGIQSPADSQGLR